MNANLVVNNFIATLATEVQSKNSLIISVANLNTLVLPSSNKQVEGFDWEQSIGNNEHFDFIVADLPLGMGREKAQIGDSKITIRKNWINLANAVKLLDPNGYFVAIVEPPAFGIAEGPTFLTALQKEGYNLCGIFNTPPGLLTQTTLRPVLVIIRQNQNSSNQIFVAELKDDFQMPNLVAAFIKGVSSKSLNGGLNIQTDEFKGFDNLKAKLQLEKLETQYKEYKTAIINDLAEEIMTVKSGDTLKPKKNSVYIPMLGSSPVAHDLSQVIIKHHNLIQVVLSPEKVNNRYVSSFLKSDLGSLILKSLSLGAVIPKIKKSDLIQAPIAIPSLEEQNEIVHSYSQLEALSNALEIFQKELALNPKSASAIRNQADKMLEQIGGLTDRDRIMSITREGESDTIEFKESFTWDVRKGTKEKYIQLSALKTIVAFLNTKGGILLIGVKDNGDLKGINEELDKFYKSEDKFLLDFKNNLKQRIGEHYYPFINHRLVDIEGVIVLIVECEQASIPCYLDGKDFYVRTNPATDKLEGPRLVEYVQIHFKQQ